MAVRVSGASARYVLELAARPAHHAQLTGGDHVGRGRPSGQVAELADEGTVRELDVARIRELHPGGAVEDDRAATGSP